MFTIAGLSSGLTIDGDGKIAGITVNDNGTSGTITISGDSVLGGKDISINNSTGYNYSLSIADSIDGLDTKTTLEVDNGTAYLTATTSKGYKLNENGVLVYSPEKVVTTTITGLSSGATSAAFSLSAATGIITVGSSALDKDKKVTINGSYTLALADNVNTGGHSTTKEWKITDLTDSATAEYVEKLHEGAFYCDGKTISVMKAEDEKSLATITGLRKGGLSQGDLNNTAIASASKAITIDDATNTLTIKGDALNDTLSKSTTGAVKISGNTYKLALDERTFNAGGSHTGGTVYTTPEPTQGDIWTFKGTTATYGGGGSMGYFTLAKDGKSVDFTPATGNTTKVTITGLNSSSKLTSDVLNGGISVAGNSILLSDDVIQGSPTTIRLSNAKNQNYTLGFMSSTSSEHGGEDAGERWYLSGTTLTLERTWEEKWTLANGGKQLTYTAFKHEGANKALAKITNVNKDNVHINNDGSIDGITVNTASYDVAPDNKSVTVADKGQIVITDENLFNEKDLAFTSKFLKEQIYDIELSSEITAPEDTNTELSISNKTTAIIKADVTPGYSVDSNGNKIKYTKDSKGTTLAKITGLQSGFTVDDVVLEDGVIKLNANALGTSKVALANSTGVSYELELDSDVVQDEEVSERWSISKTTATLNKVTSAVYKLSDDGKNVTVQKAKTTALTKLTGIKSTATVNEDGTIEGIEVTAPVYEDPDAKKPVVEEYGSIIINNPNEILDKTTLKVSSGDYKLQIEDGSYAKPEMSDENWVPGKGSAVLKGTISEGHTMADKGKSLVYSKEVKNATLATVKGLQTTTTLGVANLDTDSKTIKLSGDELTNKVTISGKYAFDFDDYENGVITGSAAADSITVDGSGVSITGGGGNDYVKMSGGGNTFVYNSGRLYARR